MRLQPSSKLVYAHKISDRKLVYTRNLTAHAERVQVKVKSQAFIWTLCQADTFFLSFPREKKSSMLVLDVTVKPTQSIHSRSESSTHAICNPKRQIREM